MRTQYLQNYGKTLKHSQTGEEGWMSCGSINLGSYTTPITMGPENLAVIYFFNYRSDQRPHSGLGWGPIALGTV